MESHQEREQEEASRLDQERVQGRNWPIKHVRHPSKKNSRIQASTNEHLIRHLQIHFYQSHDPRIAPERRPSKRPLLRQGCPWVWHCKKHHQADQRSLICRQQWCMHKYLVESCLFAKLQRIKCRGHHSSFRYQRAYFHCGNRSIGNVEYEVCDEWWVDYWDDGWGECWNLWRGRGWKYFHLWC